MLPDSRRDQPLQRLPKSIVDRADTSVFGFRPRKVKGVGEPSPKPRIDLPVNFKA